MYSAHDGNLKNAVIETRMLALGEAQTQEAAWNGTAPTKKRLAMGARMTVNDTAT
jgi:hypothetical protein